jgi:hypothetical protein
MSLIQEMWKRILHQNFACVIELEGIFAISMVTVVASIRLLEPAHKRQGVPMKFVLILVGLMATQALADIPAVPQ